MGKDTIILCFSCTAGGILLISLFLHIVVIYLLRQVQKGATNQKLLITNLSLSEVFFIPPGMVYYFRLLWTTDGTFSSEVVSVGFVAVAVNCYLANGFLTLDRTIAGLKPLRYRALFTEGRVKVIARILWVPFLFVPVVYVICGFQLFARIMIVFTLMMDFFMIVVGIMCYVCVFLAIKNRRNTFHRGDGNHGIERISARQRVKVFKVAIPVIITFFLFVTLPDVISLILAIKNIDPLFYRKILYTLSSLNFLIDPILFLHQYPPLTAQLKKRLWRDRSVFMVSSSQERTSMNFTSVSTSSKYVSNERVATLELGRIYSTKM